MKTITVLLFSLVLGGCASTKDRKTGCVKPSIVSYLAGNGADRAKYDHCRDEEADQTKAEEAKFEHDSLAALSAGTPRDTFEKYHGKPTSQEVSEGQDIYWYENDGEPLFVVYRDDKIFSLKKDRVTESGRRGTKTVCHNEWGRTVCETKN